MCTEGPNAGVVKSVDGGAIFTDVGIPSDSPAFVAPLIMDPKNPARLYSGQAHLWRTDTAASKWKNIGPPGGTPGISAVAIAPRATGTVYVGAGDNGNNGDVWLTQNATAGAPRWEPLSASLPGPLTGLAVDPTNANTLYVSLNTINSGPGGFVYRGTVAGAVPHATVKWVNISNNLPNITFSTISVDAVHRKTLYTGGYNGAFVSTNGGTTWKRLGSALPTVQVFGFAQAHKHLYAFTFGRGAYSIPLPVS
jgi:hypothetical protein